VQGLLITARRIAAGPMFVVYRKAWPQSACYAPSGIFYQLNWPCRPAIVPDIVRAATPIFSGFFRTFPVIALARVLVPVTGRFPGYASLFFPTTLILTYNLVNWGRASRNDPRGSF